MIKRLLILIILTLSFVCKGQIDNSGNFEDIDFRDTKEIKGMLYFKTDTTLVTGRVIRYNKKKVAKRYIMVRNGKPDNLGWIYFNDKYESPKENGLGTMAVLAAKTTLATAAIIGNDVESTHFNNNDIIDTDDLLDYNKEIAAKAHDDMSDRNDISKSLESKNSSAKIEEPVMVFIRKILKMVS